MGRKGFTLVEVVVILAVLAVLAGVAVPVALRIFETAAEDATREEMLSLKKAMIGDSKRLQNSVRNDFGFLGNMGRLPNNLDELFVQGTLPGYAFDSSRQAGAGWRGPYITGGFANEGVEGFKKDGLGNDYSLTVGAGGLDGSLVSNGPDGLPGTADDIVLEMLPVETNGIIRGTVRDITGNGLPSVPVTLNFSSVGFLRAVTATTDTNGNFSFSSVPFGSHSIEVNPSSGLLALSSGSVTISSNGQNITFVVLNLSSSGAVIDAVVADFGDRSSTNYDQIRINGRTVDRGNNFHSRVRVSITPTTLVGSATVRGPKRVSLGSPEVQLPDIQMSQGAPSTFELRRFNRRMNGIPFSVSFLSGGSVVGVASFVP